LPTNLKKNSHKKT